MAEIGGDIQKAIALLKAGEVIGIPTETVYGLAGNAFDPQAVARIFEIKNRPSFDPLIVHTHDIENVRSFVQAIPKLALQLAQAFWPGPLTILLPRTSAIPDLVTSGLDTVAVRIPLHPLTLELFSKLDFPLAAPSANPFGYVSPTQPAHVDEQLGRQIPYVLDGGSCTVGVESTIIGFEQEQPIIYRLGGIPVEAIEKVVGRVSVKSRSGPKPNAPGMLKSHYAPKKKVVIGDISQLLKNYPPEEVAIISLHTSFPEIAPDRQIILSEKGDLPEAAQRLFYALREEDKWPVRYILTELVPDTGLGRAINDRLKRAAAQ
jgi:L-threonylcarbamoyladenylate synthase